MNNNIYKSIINSIKITATLIGTIIGAGFASGKEICTFLGVYGNALLFLIPVYCLIYGLLTYLFLNIDNSKINPTMNKIFKSFIFISEFISLVAMIAGLEAIFSLIFTSQFPFYIALVIIFLIIITGFNGLTTTNTLLIPFLIGTIALLGITGLKGAGSLSLLKLESSKTFLTFSFPLYLGLNLFSTYPIATELSSKFSKKEKIISSTLTSVIVLLILYCFAFTVLNKSHGTAQAELPLLIYAFAEKPSLILVTAIALGVAIITTLISDGFVMRSIMQNITKEKTDLVFLLLYVSAYFISKLGFSKIVESFYPITGLLGVILTISCLVRPTFAPKQHKQLVALNDYGI